MPNLEAPPIRSEFAEAKQITNQAKLPSNKAGRDWLQWFYSVHRRLNNSPVRAGSYQLSAGDAGSATDLPVTPVPISALPAGLYRVSYIARVVTPASVSSSLEVVITWPRSAVVQTRTGAAVTGNTTASHDTDSFLVRSDANGPISVSTLYTSVGGTAMVYELDVVVEEVLTTP